MRNILISEVCKEKPNAAAFGAFNKAVSSVGVKDIYNSISGINTRKSTVSSLGTFVTQDNLNFSENKIRELRGFVGKDTIASKILNSDSNYSTRGGFQFSENQQFAIANELKKNKKFVANVAREKQLEERRNIFERAKKLSSKNKVSANKANAQSNLDNIKSQGKKLGDYYKWLNKSGNKYRSEFFSKKYSESSVNEFLNSN